MLELSISADTAFSYIPRCLVLPQGHVPHSLVRLTFNTKRISNFHGLPHTSILVNRSKVPQTITRLSLGFVIEN